MTRGQVGTSCAARSANTPGTGVPALPGGPCVIHTPLTSPALSQGQSIGSTAEKPQLPPEQALWARQHLLRGLFPHHRAFTGAARPAGGNTVINRAGGDHGCPAQTRLKQTAGCIRPKPSPRHVLAAREASTCPRPAARAAPELTGYPRGAQRAGTTSWYTHPRPSHAPAPCCFPICRLQNRQLCHPN